MKPKQRTIIPLSKTRISLFLLASCLAIPFGFWMFGLSAAEIAAFRRINSPLLIHGAGLTIIILATILWLVALFKLFDRSPGLILDEFGLCDNTHFYSAETFAWTDIAGIEVVHIQKQRGLYLLLNDPESYSASRKPLQRAMLKALQRNVPSPVSIDAGFLSIGFDDLVKLIDGRVKLHRQQALHQG